MTDTDSIGQTPSLLEHYLVFATTLSNTIAFW